MLTDLQLIEEEKHNKYVINHAQEEFMGVK